MKLRVEAIGKAGDVFHKMITAAPCAVREVLSELSDDVKDDFNKTTQSWKRSPRFTKKELTNADVIGFEVSTDNDIYRFVDKGTRAHMILPRNAMMLAFPAQYQAKTTPRVIGSQAGGSSGPSVFARGVHHPGTEARDFAETIAEKYQRIIAKTIEDRLRRVMGG